MIPRLGDRNSVRITIRSEIVNSDQVPFVDDIALRHEYLARILRVSHQLASARFRQAGG
jgi:hypothetical protein